MDKPSDIKMPPYKAGGGPWPEAGKLSCGRVSGNEAAESISNDEPGRDMTGEIVQAWYYAVQRVYVRTQARFRSRVSAVTSEEC